MAVEQVGTDPSQEQKYVHVFTMHSLQWLYYVSHSITADYSLIAELIMLQVSHSTESEIIFPYILLNIHHIKKCFK
jgi:hypothetical protein